MSYVVEPVARPYVKNSTGPSLTMIVRDEKGNRVALAGLISFYMYDPKSKTPKISAAAVIIDPDQVANPGKCSHAWLAGELDTVGSWFCRLLFGTGEWSVGFWQPVGNEADSQMVRYAT